MPTLQFRRDFHAAERMRLEAQDEAIDTTPGTTGAAVVDEEDCGVQLDLRSGRGRGVTEVEWATLLDGSRVLELLYRLEVCTPMQLFIILRSICFVFCPGVVQDVGLGWIGSVLESMLLLSR